MTLTSTYNPQNNLASVTDNVSGNVGITTYLYDSGQRLTTITTSYNGTAGPEIITSYAPNNQISAQSRTIGGSGTAVNTSYSYDAADRQTTITDYVSGGSALATYVYSYDNSNRVTTMVDAEGTYTYTYDNGNELTSVYKGGAQVEAYAYDANGNRTGTGYSTTVMNETLTSPGVITYTYDNAGNMISADSGGTFTTYTYDYRNRLTEVKQGGTLIATYTYNALDQRIGIQDSGGSTTWTIYNGTSPDALPYADFNGSGGALLTRYVSGPGMVNGAVVGELLARTSSGGTTAWYLAEKLDSVRDVVSSAGSVLDHVVYDSFGNITTETNASNGDRFKFAGMEFDATAVEYFDHARWASPTAGRFLTRDPLSFKAQDTNLYRYVHNSPTDAVDRSGELWSILAGAGMGLLWGLGTELAQHGFDYQSYNWKAVVTSTVTGALLGGFLWLAEAAPLLRLTATQIANANKMDQLMKAGLGGITYFSRSLVGNPFAVTAMNAGGAFVGGFLSGMIYVGLGGLLSNVPVADPNRMVKQGTQLIEDMSAQIAQQQAQVPAPSEWKTEFFATMDNIMKSIGAPAMTG